MYALDLALIPPIEVIERAISISAGLESSKIKLNKFNMIPHISLSMAAIDLNRSYKVLDKLEDLASKTKELKVTIQGNYQAEVLSKPVCGWAIVHNDDLLELHEKAHKLLRAYHDDDFGLDAFAEADLVLPISKSIVEDYDLKYATSNYQAHLTLGFGQYNQQEEFSFMVNNMSLYQLGNFCTCNKLISRFGLC
jgi:2'-5' RNA ligase